MDEFLKAVKKLLDAIQTDISMHGGLTSRETIRASDELRIMMARMLVGKKND